AITSLLHNTRAVCAFRGRNPPGPLPSGSAGFSASLLNAMRRRALLACLMAGLAALAAYSHVAGAQSGERIRISDPARQQHQLPAGLLVELESPNEYSRQSVGDNSGRWVGPRWQEAGHPENAGVASLD